ncbi:MAG: TetR/AcrR family transcriptional regulator [Cohaesibacter sp.]|nr:TetR/AcrR family transcriptional regulator [Cohaesibacter sp.]
MGRPKKFDQETVLSSAENCFWSHGIHRTSISALVESMNIQRSSFYNSFSSREYILGLILERYWARSPLGTLEQNVSSAQGLDYLARFFADYCYFLALSAKGKGCLFFNGMSELAPQDGQIYELFHDRYLNLIEGLDHHWQALLESNNTRISDKEDAIQHMIVTLYGINHYAKSNQNPRRLVQLVAMSLYSLSPDLSRVIETMGQDLQDSTSDLIWRDEGDDGQAIA